MHLLNRADHRRPTRRCRSLGACAALFAMAMVGCHNESAAGAPPIVMCVDPVAGLLVYVTDSTTGRPALENATVIATLSPIYADTGRFGDGAALWVGYHSGTYRVTVNKPGYLPWVLEKAEVPAAPPPCEGNPAAQIKIHAALVPSA